MMWTPSSSSRGVITGELVAWRQAIDQKAQAAGMARCRDVAETTGRLGIAVV